MDTFFRLFDLTPILLINSVRTARWGLVDDGRGHIHVATHNVDLSVPGIGHGEQLRYRCYAITVQDISTP